MCAKADGAGVGGKGFVSRTVVKLADVQGTLSNWGVIETRACARSPKFLTTQVRTERR